ncbi:hypothetical protein KGQ19_10450 [Catenulispora sp. NL8]|uniref:DUF5666 domain-containing protein n=1 Tax=Catenulispora pinistramenti TaxID=2705254 RepID=A0ABS5KMK5_9ACTN|nr:hypothetical protein [Catenulispora pinistramenti]MBS2547294.1 hypothetical protein [Catenulispora pinistramenti]
MSQDQDPIDATRPFEPIDPYNIPADQGAGPAQGYGDYQQGFEQQPYGAPQPEPQQRGVKQRLTRLGPLKLAVLGTAGVIVLGGAAWGTTAAMQSSGSSSSNTAAAAPTSGQTQSQAPGAGGTSGGAGGKHAKAGKPARIKITQVGAGSFTGTAAKGTTVTVDYDAGTKFGTKAHPLTSAQLQAGMTVTVIGERKGDTITATEVAEPAKTPKKPGTPGATSTPTDPASPVGGGA